MSRTAISVNDILRVKLATGDFEENLRFVTRVQAQRDALLAAAKAVDSLIDNNWQLARGLSNRDWVLGMQKLRRAISDCEKS